MISVNCTNVWSSRSPRIILYRKNFSKGAAYERPVKSMKCAEGEGISSKVLFRPTLWPSTGHESSRNVFNGRCLLVRVGNVS